MQIVPAETEALSRQRNSYRANGYAINISPAEGSLADELKIKLVSEHFRQIMQIIGLNTNDDGLKGTPNRLARMYVKEIFKGLDPANKPSVTFVENKYRPNEMIIEKNITLHSFCEHHFLPIMGKVHLAYISSDKIVGLSKLNRLVQHYAKRPQIQERLTEDIANALKETLGTQNVAVMIDASHLCMAIRGVRDTNCTTLTSHFSGKFQNEDIKTEFLLSVK